jgi:hypothetical protein
MARNEPDEIYQFRAVLRAISPLIWRRLLVRSDSTRWPTFTKFFRSLSDGRTCISTDLRFAAVDTKSTVTGA